MNRNKILAIVLALTLILSITSCDKKNKNNNSDDPHGQYGQHTENPENDSQQGGEGKVTYVYSVVAKTLHLPGCYHLDRMNEEYKFEYTGSITALLENGYTICKDCLVPDKKEEEPEEDDTNKIAKEDATFVINSSSKALHCLDCHIIDSMEEKNIEYTDLTLEELIALDKYKPCGFCLPDEYKEYEKNHPSKK